MAAVRPGQLFVAGDIVVVRPFGNVDIFGRNIEYAIQFNAVHWRHGEWMYAWESFHPDGTLHEWSYHYGDTSRRPMLRVGDRVTTNDWLAGARVGWVVGYDIDYTQPPPYVDENNPGNPLAGRLYYLVELDQQIFVAHELIRV